MGDVLARLSTAATEAGVASGNAELAARTVVYYVLGFTVDEQSRLQWDAAGAELPDAQSVLTEDPNARFDFGVQLLVDGIAAETEYCSINRRNFTHKFSFGRDHRRRGAAHRLDSAEVVRGRGRVTGSSSASGGLSTSRFRGTRR